MAPVHTPDEQIAIETGVKGVTMSGKTNTEHRMQEETKGGVRPVRRDSQDPGMLKRVSSLIEVAADNFEEWANPDGASAIATSIGMMKSFLGSTILTLAFAALQGSIVTSTVLLGIFCFVFLMTFYMLAESCHQTGSKKYRELWEVSVGEHSGWIVDLCICCHAWVSSIAYVLAACQYVGMVTGKSLNSDNSQPEGYWMVKLIVWGVLAVLVYPLCLLRSLSGLKYAAFFGVFCTCYLVCYVIGDFFVKDLSPGSAVGNLDQSLIFFNLQVSETIGHSAACFSSVHLNGCRFFTETKHRNPRRFFKLATICFVAAFFIKQVFSIFALGRFGKDTKDNVVKSYIDGKALPVPIIIMCLSMAVSLCLSFPMMFSASRDSFVNLLKGGQEFLRERNSLPAALDCSWEKGSRVVVTTVLWAFVVFAGTTIPQLGMVSKLKGGLFSNLLCLVLPCLIYIKLGSQKEELAGKVEKKPWLVAVAKVGLVLAVVTIVICMTNMVLGMANYKIVKNEIIKKA